MDVRLYLFRFVCKYVCECFFASMYLFDINFACDLSFWNLGYAAQTKTQFYDIAIFLSTSKVPVLVLGNLCFMIIVAIGRLLQLLFVGEISRDELEELSHNVTLNGADRTTITYFVLQMQMTIFHLNKK